MMSKKLPLALVALAATTALTLPLIAGAPVKVSEVAPAADLVAEAEAKIKLLEESLADNSKYVETNKTTLPRDAGTLAILAQGIAESEQDSALKKSAPDLRDGAIAVWSAKSYEEARKGLEAVKAAQGGKTSGAKLEHDWNKLSKLGALMKEVNHRNGKLRRATRGSGKSDASESARDSSVMAVLALAAHDDTHEVKNPADIQKWKDFSKEFQVQMTATATAFRKNDKDGAAAAYKKANTACTDCHKVFREE
jgi:cytochrome c556